ncbi:hypothetical protein SSCG_00899 [Streptomyces clavuligerus]|nr:hypothetical protein SSCG_00899 [Streptomyces clavuligerus]
MFLTEGKGIRYSLYLPYAETTEKIEVQAEAVYSCGSCDHGAVRPEGSTGETTDEPQSGHADLADAENADDTGNRGSGARAVPHRGRRLLGPRLSHPAGQVRRAGPPGPAHRRRPSHPGQTIACVSL